MAFDQPTRNRLARFVQEARKYIASEFTQQLQSLYGISEKGGLSPIEALAHLDDAGLAVAVLLRERIDYLIRSHPEEKDGCASAVARLAREQAFTVLNRLAAVRMAEKRGIIVESVGRGYLSKGFLVFSQVTGSALGETYDRYRRYLFCLFDELAVDLGVLFDRRAPQSLLFPREAALLELLKLLNAGDLEDLWAEDETIGWIYQYYNDPAERKKMREESAAPRNSRELAVRNQFFTPRYVVEFLTDNTLGRIWYEMTQGDTALKERCRFLVCRPNELFLQAGETAPEQPKQDQRSNEDLLKLTVQIPHRPLKDPRAILMLDPACGSMHFGLYAFDLFEVIYEEAWALEERLGEDALGRPPGMDSLHAVFDSRESLLEHVPRLVIEHNIHGIDIDSRASQIAGLSLWLRAQNAWQRLGLKSAERPAIKRSNIVCAEPMPGEKVLLREFITREFPAGEHEVFLRLLEAVFDKMQMAGEAGSLLKIEEEIRSAIEDARRDWQKIPEHLPGLAADDQTSDLRNLTSDPAPRPLTADFWGGIEERIYSALRDYAERAESSGGFQRRLFAEDAARGFAFIDVCRKRYDVALMNPPFGEYQELLRPYFGINYPISKNDLIGMFIERCLDLSSGGMVGTISSRTLFFLTTFEALRSRRFMVGDPPVVVADLGKDVMDNAMVEAAAYCISAGNRNYTDSVFVRALDSESRVEVIEKSLAALSQGLPFEGLYIRNVKMFGVLENSPFCYWAAPPIVGLFKKCEPLDSGDRKVRVGLQTGDDFRYIRCRWESSQVGNWVPHPKGGETIRFAADVHLCVNWTENGAEIRSDPRARVQNEPFYFLPGITSSYRCLFYSPALFPPGMITGVAGSGIYCNPAEAWWLLGLGNSKAFDALIKLRLGSSEAGIIQVGHLQASPVPVPRGEDKALLESLAREGWNRQIKLFRNQETSGYFAGVRCGVEEQGESLNFDAILRGIDAAAAKAYGIPEQDFIVVSSGHSKREENDSEEFVGAGSELVSYALGVAFGRWDVRYGTGELAAPGLPDPFAPLPICPPGQLQNAQGLPARPEDVPPAYPVRIPWDGILVDDPGHRLDIDGRVRDVFELIWTGRETGPTAEAVEQEVCEMIGSKSLRDYFRKSGGFFADHLKRYSKSRRQAPIYLPLSTASGSYTLWLYYHRLSDQTLHTCLADFLLPRISVTERELESARVNNAANSGQLQEFLDELRNLREEIEQVIKLPWRPDLNDGVLITACPLWKLFRHGKWQRDLKACWEKLAKGEYDWAHLAYSIWLERVEKVCERDRSIAIAHGLERLCKIESPKPKARKAGAKKKTVALAAEAQGELLADE
jgi:hypothetical protein